MKSAEFGGISTTCELGSRAAEGCSSMCGMCAPCVFAPKPPGFTQWKVSDEFKRRFVLDLLLQCRSVQVLESIHNVLDATSWTLSSCARSLSPTSRHHPRRGSDRALDAKPLGMDVKKIWCWFSSSPSWMQTRYLCRILSRCDPELVRMAFNLTNVILIRHKRGFLQSSSSTAMNKHNQDRDEDEDPALMVVPGSTKSVSGVSRHRDFIGCLPVDLSKRILGLLEEHTLRRCLKVCRYWHQLAKETMEEMKFRIIFQEQIKAMMTRCKAVARVSPTYANFVAVPIPRQDAGTEDAQAVQEFTPFEAAYAKIKTQTVRMEERNVYCGAYFTKVLLNKEDPHRVVDYGGGALMAAGSKDRAVQLFYVASETKALSVMKGHVASIRAVLLLEDRRLVATASSDASIRCWNLKTDKCEMTLYGHSGAVTCLDVHADTLVSGAKDCRVKVWDLNTGTHVKGFNFKHPASVRCVKIRAATIYSSCDRGLVKVWDVEKASAIRVIHAHRSSVKCLFLDEWHLLSGDASGQVMAWSVSRQARQCLITFTHPQEVKSLSLVYLRVVTGCADGVIRIFNFLTGDCLRNITAVGEAGCLLSLRVSEDSILVNTTSTVKLFQFGKVFWDHTEAAQRVQADAPPLSVPVSGTSGASHRILPCTSVQAASVGCCGSKNQAAERIRHMRILSSAPLARCCKTDEQSLMLSERAACERVRKRGLHHPPTRDCLLLRVSALQRARGGDEVSTNMERNASLRDSWGPRAAPQGPLQAPHSDGPRRAQTCAARPKKTDRLSQRDATTAPGSVARCHPCATADRRPTQGGSHPGSSRPLHKCCSQPAQP